MAGQELVQLPGLKHRGHCHTIPRRYEQTQPALLQNFCHRKIIDLGQDLYRQCLQDCEHERCVAVHTAEEAVWALAADREQQAIHDAIIKAQAEHAKVFKKVRRAHVQELKEELAHLASEMEKKIREELERQKQMGQNEQILAVERTEEQCRHQLLDAVAEARREGKQAAAEQAIQANTAFHARMVASMEAAEDAKQQALGKLGQQKDAECADAVKSARQEEQTTAAERLAHTRHVYEQQVAGLKAQLTDSNTVELQLEQRMTTMLRHNDTIMGQLHDIRNSFQKFINSVQPFSDGQADFLLPPLNPG